jgi:hypothetical protein
VEVTVGEKPRDAMNGRIVEITRKKQKLWKVLSSSKWIYRATSLPPSFFTEW